MRMLRSMKTETSAKLVSFRSQPICMSVRLRNGMQSTRSALLAAFSVAAASCGTSDTVGRASLEEGDVSGGVREAGYPPMRFAFTDPEDLSPGWEEYSTLRQECLTAAGFLTNPCPRIYTDREQRILLLEVCTDGSEIPPGIHIVRQDGGRKSFEWFDPQFNTWACNEGCNDVGSCYFDVARPFVLSDTLEVTYHYDINLSYGEYLLHLAPDGTIDVVSKKKTNMPS